MSIYEHCIKRPIATTLLAIGLAIAGLCAFNILPLAPLPQVDFPTISVTTQLPGSSPENIATSITSPLERQFGRISGLTQMTSSSTLGLSRIVMQFDLSRNIDGAARDVQSAINAAKSQLPDNLPAQPNYRKVNPADSPILILALTSDKLSKGQIYDAAATIMQQKLSQMSGVGQVMVSGSSLPAIRIDLNPTQLNSYDIGLPDVAAAISRANVISPKGQMALNNELSTELVTNDQIFKSYDYAPLIISYKNNSPVRLSDVAYVHEDIEDVRNGGVFNGKTSVLLVIFKQPGANVIDTVDEILATLPQLKASISKDIQMTLAIDRTITIRVSLLEVEFTLIIAMILVIFVTYLFLGSIRAMLIPGIAVPLSLLGTFCFMTLLGYSLDNISFMALIISTGFVVDDAVIVLENITRHLESGMSPIKAAYQGTKEVSFTVISMSLSLIAVFIPILLMGGLVGRLFREFAVTLSIAIMLSMIISLTLTPMMCSILLKKRDQKPSNRWLNWISKLHTIYQKSLDWALSHFKLMLLVFLLTIGLNIFLFIMVPKGFFPQQDIGLISGTIQIDQNLSFGALQKKLNEFVRIIKEDNAVENVIGIIGGPNNLAPGSVFITLKPLESRDASAFEVIHRLRAKTAQVTGTILYLQAVQDLMVGGRQANAQFQYTLFGQNMYDLDEWATKVVMQLRKEKELLDVSSDQKNQGLQEYITIDRDSASRFGITAKQIDSTLYHAFGQSQISTMYTSMNQYHVVMEVAPKYWQRPETLEKIYIKSSKGEMVPLSAIAKFTPLQTLLAVNHQDQGPSVTISFNLLPGAPLGVGVDIVNKAIKNLHLPKHVRGSFQGTAQAFQASMANEPYLLLAAIIAVYIVLGILYESLIHPVTILSTLPSAGIGALLALMISKTELSIIALIGIILLIGIVKKNAIMMIDFALYAERIEKKPPRDAIYEAALLRFRPIMMTTIAAMLGAIPLIFGFGLGAELRQPLGIAIFGGLLVSQLLTLYTTPVIYLAMENMTVSFHAFMNKKRHKRGSIRDSHAL